MAEEFEQLYIETFDGTFLNGELRLPAGEGPHPAVIYVHGGRGGSPPGPTYSPLVRSHLMANGFAYLDLDYRKYSFGPNEIEDVVAGYRYLCSRPEIDDGRVALLGDSHGGFIVLMAATRIRPAAVVVYAGIADPMSIFFEKAKSMSESTYRDYDWYEKWIHGGLSIREESDQMDLGTLPDREPVGVGVEVIEGLSFRWGTDEEIYRRYSPVDQVQLIESPVLYVVGSEDGFKTHGEKLVERLRALGREAIYSEHPGRGHSFAFGKELDDDGNIHPEFYRSLQLTTSFLRQWVRDRE